MDRPTDPAASQQSRFTGTEIVDLFRQYGVREAARDIEARIEALRVRHPAAALALTALADAIERHRQATADAFMELGRLTEARAVPLTGRARPRLPTST
jgi:hypothetical protein